MARHPSMHHLTPPAADASVGQVDQLVVAMSGAGPHGRVSGGREGEGAAVLDLKHALSWPESREGENAAPGPDIRATRPDPTRAIPPAQALADAFQLGTAVSCTVCRCILKS